MKKQKVYYYSSYNEDFITNSKKDLINKKRKEQKILASFLYFVIVLVSFIYVKFILHVKIKNKNILKRKTGYFLYANHTLPINDALMPFLLTFPIKPFFIVDSDNLRIPFIGDILPSLGALVVPNNIFGMKEFINIVNKQSRNHPIIIYPEAHVWPFCTFIRDYPRTSFHFPIENKLPTYVMTTTFQKRKWIKFPKIIVYIDGPFYSSGLANKEQIIELHDKVFECMVNRSFNSNFEYVKYIKKD